MEINPFDLMLGTGKKMINLIHAQVVKAISGLFRDSWLCITLLLIARSIITRFMKRKRSLTSSFILPAHFANSWKFNRFFQEREKVRFFTRSSLLVELLQSLQPKRAAILKKKGSIFAAAIQEMKKTLTKRNSIWRKSTQSTEDASQIISTSRNQQATLKRFIITTRDKDLR